MVADVVMWILSIILLVCVLVTCFINIVTSYEKQDQLPLQNKLGERFYNKIWDVKRETRVPVRKIALGTSIATLVSLVLCIIVGAASAHGKEAFYAFMP